MAGESSEAQAPVPTVDVRASMVAELDALPGDDAPPVVAEAESDVEEETESEETEPVEASDEDDADEDEDTVDEDEDDEPAKDADPETQKRLDTVRRAEKRSRVAIERERAEFAAERQQWQVKIDKVSEFEGLARRAKYDPASVLRALGVSDDDFEVIAHAIYGESTAAAADPKQKAAATARLKEREKDDKLTAAEKRMADLEAKFEKQQQEATVQAESIRYIEQVNAAASAKFPLVAHMLKVDAEDANAALVAAYDRLVTAKPGRTPKPAEVVAEFDRKERSRLKRLGIDADTLIKAKPAAVAAKVVTKTNGTAVTKPGTGSKSREEILAELDALQ